MKISHDCTLDDIAEGTIRVCLRGNAARRRKLVVALIGGVCGMVAAFLVLSGKATGPGLVLWALVGGAVGGGLIFMAFPALVKSRVRAYFRRELNTRFPITSTWEVGGGRLVHEATGVKLTFELATLTAVAEDKRWVELAFGAKGLELIPQAAFADAERKARFLKSVRGG